MRKIFTIFSFVLVLSFSGFAQIPPAYYDDAEGLAGQALRQALHDIVDDHTALQYGNIYDILDQTDEKPDGKVWDMYSDVPGGTPPYEYTFFEDQCGNYNGEGVCYNKEHSWPKSWFGGKVYPMYSDLFHIVPTDGYVNGKRSNYPFGEVGSVSWESENGSKLGNCSYPGYSSKVFEPIDEYKGDFARSYFYMSTRYYGEDGNWPGSDMVDGAEIKPWALQMLLEWHNNDPVSNKETNRCNAIYNLQENRNPFIDHPEYVAKIWVPGAGVSFAQWDDFFEIYASPNGDILHVSKKINAQNNNYQLQLFSISGQLIQANVLQSQDLDWVLNTASKGCYILILSDQSNAQSFHYKFIR
ncbi:MAG: hypothetical protein B7C24_10240 [Bacteroidetes bacterium 4572_77]|nr:MAG: hypothetical protein B7C24_10240 [Bacteroidetes bacterium 4572_77]